MKSGWIKVTPIIDKSVIALCTKPYPNHKKGCPNFGKKKDCPPTCGKIEDTIDLSKDVYAIYNVFPFKEHVDKLREKHPKWTQRQLECCLYWQTKARKQLKLVVKDFLKCHKNMIILATPEALGVNLTATMKSVGIELEWPPKTVTYQIVLGGFIL
jgi:predicted metal-binding protein